MKTSGGSTSAHARKTCGIKHTPRLSLPAMSLVGGAAGEQRVLDVRHAIVCGGWWVRHKSDETKRALVLGIGERSAHADGNAWTFLCASLMPLSVLPCKFNNHHEASLCYVVATDNTDGSSTLQVCASTRCRSQVGPGVPAIAAPGAFVTHRILLRRPTR